MRYLLLLLLLCSPVRADSLLLEWPQGDLSRQSLVYWVSSLLPVGAASHRPTVPERLARPPYVVDGARVGLELDRFDAPVASALKAASRSGVLTAEALATAGEPFYLARRGFPERMTELAASLGDRDRWSSVDVRSLITRGTRRVHFQMEPVLSAAAAAFDTTATPAVAPQTTYVAEELDSKGLVEETHVTRLRADREWDFALYDREGRLRPRSETSPMLMRSPATCFVCHRNARRMPPFAAFPDPSPPVGDFAPGIAREFSAGEIAILRAFATADRKQEGVLGTYAGLAALELRARGSDMPAWAKALWPRLVARVPALAGSN